MNDLVLSIQQLENAEEKINSIQYIPNKLNLLQMNYYKMLMEQLMRLIDILHKVLPHIPQEEIKKGWSAAFSECHGDLEKITSATFNLLKILPLDNSISILKNYKALEKIKHRVPMLSLGNAFNEEDLKNFEKKIF